MLTIAAREGATPPVAVQLLPQYGRAASKFTSVEALKMRARKYKYLHRCTRTGPAKLFIVGTQANIKISPLVTGCFVY